MPSDISDPKQLKNWLLRTGREFLVFQTADLVDGLSWPDGVNKLIEIIGQYKTHRQSLGVGEEPCPACAATRKVAVATGAAETGPCAACRGTGKIPNFFRDEILDLDELEALQVWTAKQIKERQTPPGPGRTVRTRTP